MTPNPLELNRAELEADHERTLAAVRAANERLARLTLLLIALKCTEHDPNRLTLEVEDHDDEDAGGRIVPVVNHTLEAIESDLWDLCSALDDSNKHIWGGYLQGGLRKHTNSGTLDLGLILTMTNVEPELTT